MPARRSFQNSQSGEFGPFSRYVPVEKPDGTFLVLTVNEFERLKKEKKVVKQRFVDAAAAAPFEQRQRDLSLTSSSDARAAAQAAATAGEVLQ